MGLIAARHAAQARGEAGVIASSKVRLVFSTAEAQLALYNMPRPVLDHRGACAAARKLRRTSMRKTMN